MNGLDMYNNTLLDEYLESQEGNTIVDFADACDFLLEKDLSLYEIEKIVEPLWEMQNYEDVAEEVSDLIIYWREFVTIMIYRAPSARLPELLEAFDIMAQFGEKDVDVQELADEQFRLGYWSE